ncbi:MAG TPA: hypothetical protein VFE14_10730 [Micromonosporaceae bacterium]|jgi:flagellar biosynthesis/type III secretory pathway M-ring protein FliF/YscJ|nr:hypothetical protein [Micromonosporaceae bacterium]
MVWWVMAGALLLGIVVLLLAVRPVVRRLPGLTGALNRLQSSAGQAEELRTAAEELQNRMLAMQEDAARLAARKTS